MQAIRTEMERKKSENIAVQDEDGAIQFVESEDDGSIVFTEEENN